MGYMKSIFHKNGRGGTRPSLNNYSNSTTYYRHDSNIFQVIQVIAWQN